MNLHVGQGKLTNDTYNVLSSGTAQNLKTINIDQPVQLPSDCSYLFANLSHMTHVNGTYNLDTSQTNNFSMMFAGDTSLQNIDLSSFQTANVYSIFGLFANDTSLQSINVSGWDMHNVTTSAWAFTNDASLTNLDLSSWHINNLSNAYNGMFSDDPSLKSLNIANINFASNIHWEHYIFGGANSPDGMFGDNNEHATGNLSRLTLGKDSTIHGTENMPNAIWKAGNQFLSTHQLFDGNNHAGTWIKQ